MSAEAEIQFFVECLRVTIPDIVVSIDEPENPNGESWIDIRCGSYPISISYRPRHGFGVYISADAYGERPDEVYRSAKTAAKRLTQICLEGRNGRPARHMTLGDLRRLHDKTQAALAESMHIKQPAVAKKEKSTDQMLSALATYVAALGGRVETRVIFDDVEAVLLAHQPDDQEVA